MKNKIKILTIILVLSLVLVGCLGKVNADIPKVPINNNPPVETMKPIQVEPTEEEKQRLEFEKQKEERKELEKQRKQEQKEFYVPLVPIENTREKKSIKVKALYATGYTAGNELDKTNIDAYGSYVKALNENDTKKANELYAAAQKANKFEKIIGIAVGTEINGLVINVKDDNGYVTYKSNVEIVKNINNNVPISIKDINKMLSVLKEYDIYTIGRIVTFKDKHFAKLSPEHSIKLKSGGVWLDPNSGNIPWINPFDKYVWDYNVAIAKEAALLGFDEIQFDYVRFPDGARKYNPITEFPGRLDRDKDENIAQFLEYAKKELEPYKVNIGADVFGITTRTWDDYPEDIGQTWILMGKYVDNMAPMVYPSHYSTGWYNLDNPNAHPYLVVKGAMQEALEKNASMQSPPSIRPWIQDFDWKDIKYGPNEVRDQIIAAKELGIDEYMVWNPSNSYNPYSFLLTQKEKNTKYPLDRGELDLSEKSPSDSVYKYLFGLKNKMYSNMYLMTLVDSREESFDEYVKSQEELNINLVSYKVYGYEIDKTDQNKATVKLYYKIEVKNGEKTEITEQDNVIWSAIRENGIWKVQPKLR